MRAIPPLTITAGILTSSTIAEPSAGETAWVSGTTYAAGDVRIVAAQHRKYQRISAGAGTISPELDTANWLDIGPTNRWAMFDTLRNSASTATTSMTVVITPGQRVDSIALIGMVGETVTITVTSGGSTVYTVTDNLIRRNSTGWYKYFFGAFTYGGSAIHFDLPPYTNAVITVTVARATGTVSLGALVLGQSVYLGKVLSQAQSVANNFSTVTRDAFGNATLVQRRTIPGTSQTLHASNDMVDTLRYLRALGNATPMVWSGLDDKTTNACFEALLILGVYKEFNISMENNGYASVTLSLEEI